MSKKRKYPYMVVWWDDNASTLIYGPNLHQTNLSGYRTWLFESYEEAESQYVHLKENSKEAYLVEVKQLKPRED